MIRLLFAGACALLALLAVLPAPTSTLWQVRILVTEAGVMLAALSFLVFVPGWRRTRAGRAAAILSVCAAALAISPLLRGVVAARAARMELGRSFPVNTRTAAQDMNGAPTTYTYADDPATPLQLALYRAAGNMRPVVVVIHGGSWRGGDRGQLPTLNTYLAQRGYSVAAIDYRLAPQHPFPAAVEDVLRAIAWLKTNAAALAIDPERIVLLGRSAGGQLALLTAYTSGDPAIRGAISFYGPTDLRWGWEHPANPRVIDSRGTLAQYLGGPLSERGGTFDHASPVRFAASAVPTLLVHGRMDELVSPRHSQMLAAELERHGVPYAHVVMPWATHACDYVFWGPCGRITTRAVEDFLGNILNGG